MIRMVSKSVLDFVGNTPLIQLNSNQGVFGSFEANLYAKVEYVNPSGSIKDRIAKYMIEAAERDGLLQPGFTIIEASTGNTATSLAFVGSIKGYDVQILGPQKTLNPQRVAIMRAYGCNIQTIDTDAYEARQKDLDSSVHGGTIEVLPRRICLAMEKEQTD